MEKETQDGSPKKSQDSQTSPRRPSTARRVSSHATHSSADADHEKTLLGQAPLPIQPQLPLNDSTQLQKLDSKVVEVKEGDENDPFKHLPDNEKAILKRQLDTPDVKVGFFTLFRYATNMDISILVISTICTIAAGAAMPLMTVSRSLLPANPPSLRPPYPGNNTNAIRSFSVI
jgi:hypothetical protein